MTKFAQKQKHRKKGAATIELAVCLPVIVLLVLGSLEACNVIFLKQMVTAAAYEAARVAASPEAGSNDAEQRAADVLESRGVAEFSYSSNPTDPSLVDSGDQIAVTVSAPASANSMVNFGSFSSTNVAATVVMQKQ